MVSVYIGHFVIPWFGGPTAPTIALPLPLPLPLPLVIMFMLAVGLVGGLSVAIERFACRPLRDAPLTGAHNDLIWAPVVMNAADVVAAQNGGSRVTAADQP